MSLVWRAETPLVLPRRVGRDGRERSRGGVPLLLLLGGGLALLLAVRLIERPLFGPRRPMTPWITVVVCRGALRLLGLDVRRQGAMAGGPGAVVANHSSWLDILALNAGRPVVFVAKSEVGGWAGIGWLARATGTIFVRREARSEAAQQVATIRARVARGETVVLFPEGTSTDGRRLLPFKPALLGALAGEGLPEGTAVQPVTLGWRAPEGQDPRFYGWFDGADFGPHALAVLAVRRPGGVTITHHPPIPVAGRDRKAIARDAEAAIRSALP